MEINTIGVVLSYYRERYHLPLAEMCEGICSATTLFRMEQGYWEAMCMRKSNAPEDRIAVLLKEAIELTKPKYGKK